MRPKHGVSALRLILWDIVSSKDITQPAPKDDETMEEFSMRSNEWMDRHGDTARLIYYLEHRGGYDTASLLAKTEFLADMVWL